MGGRSARIDVMSSAERRDRQEALAVMAGSDGILRVGC
jgi:hypothetical protein